MSLREKDECMSIVKKILSISKGRVNIKFIFVYKWQG